MTIENDEPDPPLRTLAVISLFGKGPEDVLREVWPLLGAQHVDALPWTFVRGGLAMELRPPDGSATSDGLPTLCRPLYRRVREFLRKTIGWQGSGATGETSTAPPPFVTAAVRAATAGELPELRDIVTVPVLVPGGAILGRGGYHQPSRTWHHRTVEGVGPVPRNPSRAEVGRARQLWMDEVFDPLPMPADCDRAHAMALCMLPFVRTLIEGPTPLHVCRPSFADGVVVIDDLLRRLLRGRCGVLGSAPSRSQIYDQLSAAATIIAVPDEALESVLVRKALRAGTWDARKNAQSERRPQPNRAIRIAGARRPWVAGPEGASIEIRLGVPKPMAVARLQAFVDAHRAELCRAALTLARAWWAEGCPSGSEELVGFEAWSHVVGGVLDVSGVPGFLQGEAGAQPRLPWERLVERWWVAHRSRAVTARDLLRLLPLSSELEGLFDADAFEQQLRRVVGETVGEFRVCLPAERFFGVPLFSLEPQGQLADANPRSLSMAS